MLVFLKLFLEQQLDHRVQLNDVLGVFRLFFLFQKQQKQGFSATKQSTTTFKDRNKSANKRKFVGVRQRPSGKWVAEIKNTTQKIRMWLGTFDTAEEAARAYDEAACLLRGSNTRTNFATHVSANSPLSLKIRNLLDEKRRLKQNPPFVSSTTSTTTPTKSTIQTSTKTSPHCSSSNSTSFNSCNSNNSLSTVLNQHTHMFDDAYKPDLSHCIGGFEMDSSHFHHPAASFTTEFDRLPVTYNGFEVPKRVDMLPEISEPQIPDFERMKVERQISASLYAMNGVNEYWENIHDCSDAFWDLPMLCQMFCPS
ncbi:hypothetical protein F0562_001310 [Nyssa sinensis]|uniref:AP2/ERF domain-containing protein n=1 Tax=Nyssa sinensis TaxID=561372 RepID=A0A5J5C6S3_9ASTE|nr:hypothetical protein F0562_001310 [Nyssa sinensis]